MGLRPVAVRVPPVSQGPEELAPQGCHSQVVRRYQRASQTTQRLFARLYPSAGSGQALEGLATGDFSPDASGELVGETTALSANTVVRLKEHWGQEYQEWRQRSLRTNRHAYIWADGVYLAAGTAKEKTALLWILGGPGRRREGTAGHGAGLPGEHRELGGSAKGPEGPGADSAPTGGG